jgi:4-hydroxy-tetrahydrodipicolinate synthase
VDRIIGIKDSSGDLDYFQQLMTLRTERPDWSIMIGPEAMLPEAMAVGGDGGVAGGANAFPRLFVDCYDACVAGDRAKLQKCRNTINEFQKVYDIGKYASRHIKATKCALSLLGICDDFMAEPFHRFHPPDRVRVREVLESLDVPVEIRHP